MKIVLAYSGGLDTSVLLSWIKETYGNAEMIAFCANIGQEDELKGLEKKAAEKRLAQKKAKEEEEPQTVFPWLWNLIANAGK